MVRAGGAAGTKATRTKAHTQRSETTMMDTTSKTQGCSCAATTRGASAPAPTPAAVGVGAKARCHGDLPEAAPDHRRQAWLPYGPAAPDQSAASKLAERDPSNPDICRLLLDNDARFLGFSSAGWAPRRGQDILQDAFVAASVGRTPCKPPSRPRPVYRCWNALIDHHHREGSRSRAFLQFAVEAEGEPVSRQVSSRPWRAPASRRSSTPQARVRVQRFAGSISTVSVSAARGGAGCHTCGTPAYGCVVPARPCTVGFPGAAGPARLTVVWTAAARSRRPVENLLSQSDVMSFSQYRSPVTNERARAGAGRRY